MSFFKKLFKIAKIAAPIIIGAATGQPWLAAAAGAGLGATGGGGIKGAIIGGIGGYAGGSLGSGLANGFSATAALPAGTSGPVASGIGGFGQVVKNTVSGAFSGLGSIASKALTGVQLASAVSSMSSPASSNAVASANKPVPTAAMTAQATAAAKEEETRRARLLALQAGAGGQMTPAGGVTGQATVARKTLLGM